MITGLIKEKRKSKGVAFFIVNADVKIGNINDPAQGLMYRIVKFIQV